MSNKVSCYVPLGLRSWLEEEAKHEVRSLSSLLKYLVLQYHNMPEEERIRVEEGEDTRRGGVKETVFHDAELKHWLIEETDRRGFRSLSSLVLAIVAHFRDIRSRSDRV